jgi:hypothetical protein
LVDDEANDDELEQYLILRKYYWQIKLSIHILLIWI